MSFTSRRKNIQTANRMLDEKVSTYLAENRERIRQELLQAGIPKDNIDRVIQETIQETQLEIISKLRKIL